MRKILALLIVLAACALIDLGPAIVLQIQQEVARFFQECHQGVERVYYVSR